MHLALFLKGNGFGIKGDAPDTTCGATYNFTYTVHGGTGPFTFSVTSGDLPQGLSLDPDTGEISGTVICPVEEFLTSTVYPIETIENIAFTSGFGSNQCVLYQGFIENITHTATVLSGEIRTILKSYNAGFDEITHTASVLGGEIRTILKSYNAGFDEITHTAAILGGSIENKLVTYSNYQPEAITHTATILGGSLT